MERQKRVYPLKQNSRILCSILLGFAALIIVSGLIHENDFESFMLEKQASPTAIPMNEAFDETATEMTVDLPAAEWFAIQLGAYESAESANESAQVFQKRGAAGFLWLDGRYRVLAAVYPERADAQNVREQLREQHNIDSYLYTIALPAVSMKLKGMQGQLEILRAAFEHANDLAVHLQNVWLSLDRQEISLQEAFTKLDAVHTQINLVALRLRQRFSKPYHVTVQALLDCFEQYDTFLAQNLQLESTVALGTKLKYQTFLTLQHIQKVYQTLNHT